MRYSKYKLNSNIKWILPPYKMTYIIGGKFNNKPFLMVDSIVNNDISVPKVEKILKSIKYDKTYFSLSGTPLLVYLLSLYDEYCQLNNLEYDIDDKTLDILIKEYEYRSELLNCDDLGINRIFYIKDDSIEIIKMDYNSESKKIITKEILEIQNNEYILNFGSITKIEEGVTDIRKFCIDTFYNAYLNPDYGRGQNINFFDNNISTYINGEYKRNEFIYSDFKKFVDSHS